MNRQHGRLGHRVEKKKIYVTEADGSVLFKYVIDPLKLTCQCSRKAGSRICYHLKYYLVEVMGVPEAVFPVLHVPRVKDKIVGMSSSELTDYCSKFLTDEDEDHCSICFLAYIKAGTDTPNLYQCPVCSELFHQECYTRWHCGGVNSCPRCKYIKSLPV
jgi:hypothetical protein